MADTAWPEVAGSSEVLVVPVGACEQHGPHLPLTTDADIATGLAERLAAVSGVDVAPVVAFGASGEHAGFPVLSIGVEVLRAVLVELGRSWDGRLLFLNAHGGNLEALSAAVDLLRYEGRDVRAWSPRWGGDAHAGFVETSVMLALRPAAVRVQFAQRGRVEPLAELLPALRERGVRAVSPNGVLGDPAGASAAEGERLLAAAVAELRELVDAWPPPPARGDAPGSPTAVSVRGATPSAPAVPARSDATGSPTAVSARGATPAAPRGGAA